MSIKKKRTTISDVAKETGVSPATVSRVLSGSSYPVKKEVREKILQVASQLYYKPNILSQMLRGGTSREIGVIIPSLVNPFYAQLVSTVERTCIERGYTPIICSSQDKYQLEAMHFDMLQKKQVAGFLISSIHLDTAFLKTLQLAATPFVLFDQPHNGQVLDSVSFDFQAAGFMATQYLLEAGHKYIVFASGPLDRHSREQLFTGYKKALQSKHIRFLSQNLLISEMQENQEEENSFRDGQVLGTLLLEREYLPDAVFAVNDMMAIGIIKALQKEGVRIPSDISIIGCDNIIFSEMLAPSLTTIDQPAGKTGLLATNILIDRIESKTVLNNQIVLQPTLIERDSVRKVHYKVRR